jgi:hypothetical protein
MGNCTNCLNQTIKLNKSKDIMVDDIDDKNNIDNKKESKLNNDNGPLSTLKMIYKENKTLQNKNSSLNPNPLKSKKNLIKN